MYANTSTHSRKVITWFLLALSQTDKVILSIFAYNADPNTIHSLSQEVRAATLLCIHNGLSHDTGHHNLADFLTIRYCLDMAILLYHGRKYVRFIVSRCLMTLFDRRISAWWINDRPRPAQTHMLYSLNTNITSMENQAGIFLGNSSLIDYATSYPVWRALSSDIFTGQLIATMIILIFLGVFLLREWIMQNARPDVFEDDFAEEGPVEMPVIAEAAAPLQAEAAEEEHIAPVQPDEPANADDGIGLDSLPAHSTAGATSELGMLLVPASPDDEAGDSFIRIKRRRRLDSSPEADSGIPSRLRPQFDRASTRRRDSITRTRGRRSIRKVASDSDMHTNNNGSINSESESQAYRFTFSVDAGKGESGSLQNEACPSVEGGLSLREFSFELAPGAESSSNSTQHATISDPLVNQEIEAQGFLGNGLPRRPPLPTISLSSTGKLVSREEQPLVQSFDATNISSSARVAELHDEPLASPSLSTYHSPEQFEAGPSSLVDSEYFTDSEYIKVEREQEVSSSSGAIAECIPIEDDLDASEEDSDESDVEDADEQHPDEFDHIDDLDAGQQDRQGVDEEQNADFDALLGDAVDDPDLVNGGEGALEGLSYVCVLDSFLYLSFRSHRYQRSADHSLSKCEYGRVQCYRLITIIRPPS